MVPPKLFKILDFYFINLPKTFKRSMVNPPPNSSSSYFLYDTSNLVQFYICYYFDHLFIKS